MKLKRTRRQAEVAARGMRAQEDGRSQKIDGGTRANIAGNGWWAVGHREGPWDDWSTKLKRSLRQAEATARRIRAQHPDREVELGPATDEEESAKARA